MKVEKESQQQQPKIAVRRDGVTIVSLFHERDTDRLDLRLEEKHKQREREYVARVNVRSGSESMLLYNSTYQSIVHNQAEC